MGFLSDALLGSNGSVDVRSLTTLTPEQQQSLQALLKRITDRSADPNGQLSPMEQTSLTALEQRAQAMAVPSAARGKADDTVTSLMDFEGQTGDASAFFRDRVQNPLLDSFQREILPQISRSFGGADFFTSERQNAEGLARQDLLNSLAGAKSEVELDQFNQARDRSLTAAGLVPQLTQSDNQTSQVLIDILKAAGLPADRQRQDEEILARLLGIQGVENLATVQPGNAGAIPTLVGGLAGGVGDALGSVAGDGIKNVLGRLFGGSGAEAGVTAAGGGATTLGMTGAGLGAGTTMGAAGPIASALPVNSLMAGIGAGGGTAAATGGTAALAGGGALDVSGLLAGIGQGGATSAGAATAGAGAATAGSGATAGAGAAGMGALGTAAAAAGMMALPFIIDHFVDTGGSERLDPPPAGYKWEVLPQMDPYDPNDRWGGSGRTQYQLVPGVPTPGTYEGGFYYTYGKDKGGPQMRYYS